MKIAPCRIWLRSQIYERKSNSQADNLSNLNKVGEKILHDENYDIPVFELRLVNVELELKKLKNEFDFIHVQYAELDELYETIDDPALSHTNVKKSKLTNSSKHNSMTNFAPKSSAIFMEVRIRHLISTMMEFLSGLETREYKSLPESLKDLNLHINRHSLLAGHPGGRKIYYRIRKDF